MVKTSCLFSVMGCDVAMAIQWQRLIKYCDMSFFHLTDRVSFYWWASVEDAGAERQNRFSWIKYLVKYWVGTCQPTHISLDNKSVCPYIISKALVAALTNVQMYWLMCQSLTNCTAHDDLLLISYFKQINNKIYKKITKYLYQKSI